MPETPKEGRKDLPRDYGTDPTENPVKVINELGNMNRLSTVVSVGKKPEVYEVKSTEIDSLRPEMKNG